MDEPKVTKNVVHFALSQDDMRMKTKKHGRFSTQALCGNGNYHARKAKSGITCPTCLELMRQKKHRGYSHVPLIK